MMNYLSRLTVVVLVFAGTSGANAHAQSRWQQHPPVTMDLSGPRVGVTFLSDGVRERLKNDFKTDLGAAISQFGWQKERRFLSSPDGFTGVTELVLLVGGMDQGAFIPSASWLVGARTINGVEFAAGPNLSPGGFGLVLAGGVTFKAGSLNIPLNVAVVPSKQGVRVSMLAGFNGRQ